MRELEQEKDALKRLIAQAIGEDHRQPSMLAGQVRVSGLELDLLALPVARSSEQAIQVMTPGDPLYGSFRFQAGVSRLDLGDKSDVLL